MISTRNVNVNITQDVLYVLALIDECAGDSNDCNDTELCVDKVFGFDCQCGVTHKRNLENNLCEPKLACPNDICWSLDQVKSSKQISLSIENLYIEENLALI